MTWDIDAGPQTAEEWIAFRAQDTRECREWSCAEERAYHGGLFEALNAAFKAKYSPWIVELVPGRIFPR